MNIINRQKAIEIINDSKGKFCSAVFTKRDGSDRTINFRTGVTKNLTGKGMSYDARSRGLIPVWCLKSDDYRMINVNTLKGLQVNGEVYVVADNE